MTNKAHRHLEREPNQQTKNKRAAWLELPCEICGKKRQHHTSQEANMCDQAIANHPDPVRKGYF